MKLVTARLFIVTAVSLSSHPIAVAGTEPLPGSVEQGQSPPPPLLSVYSDLGYETQYNFRGTNLTPDADGALFMDAEVSRWNFTLGFYGIRQIGSAHTDSFVVGEGGGGGQPVGAPNIGGLLTHAEIVPETIQDQFSEEDIFLQYHVSVGVVEFTGGNIAFFIQRNAETFVTVSNVLIGQTQKLPGPFVLKPLPSVGDETFDRLFFRLATSKIPHVTLQVTYYQTVLNTGDQPSTFHIQNPTLTPLLESVKGNANIYHGGERNEALGGYLEGRARGSFTLASWCDFNPYAVLAASFHDRTEPFVRPLSTKDGIRGHTLSGLSHTQVGMECRIRVWAPHSFSASTPNVYVVPFAAYVYHISRPTPGTAYNEGWGGVKLALTF